MLWHWLLAMIPLDTLPTGAAACGSISTCSGGDMIPVECGEKASG